MLFHYFSPYPNWVIELCVIGYFSVDENNIHFYNGVHDKQVITYIYVDLEVESACENKSIQQY